MKVKPNLMKVLVLEKMVKEPYNRLTALLNWYEKMSCTITPNGDIVRKFNSPDVQLILDANIKIIMLAMFYQEKQVLVDIPIEPDEFGIHVFSMN